MNILILCKQRPLNRDLLSRPYGRFYYLAKFLALNGHEVHFMLLNYKLETHRKIEFSHIKWNSISVFSKLGFTYYNELKKTIKSNDINWIIGFSDTYFGILANRLAKKYKVSCLIDAYDNYESYIPWFKPLHYLWREALSQADLVTVAGPSLAKLIRKVRADKPILIIPMAADPEFTNTLDKMECRKSLGLTLDSKLVGYCGGVHNNRGIKHLFEAFRIIKHKWPDIEFIVSGRISKSIRLPEFITSMGYLQDDRMPCLIRSLDVLISVNLDSDFGNYSYPVKIYEAMQTNTPVVASATDSTKWILTDYPNLLTPPGNPTILADIIMDVIDSQTFHYNQIEGWDVHAQTLEHKMAELFSS